MGPLLLAQPNEGVGLSSWIQEQQLAQQIQKNFWMITRRKPCLYHLQTGLKFGLKVMDI